MHVLQDFWLIRLHRRLEKQRQVAEPGRMLAAVEALQKEKYLVLLGDPGSGKSTFVNYVSMCMAREILGRTEANLSLLSRYMDRPEEGKKDRVARFREPLIPIKVILRDFVARLLEQPDLTLWQFMSQSLQKRDHEEYVQRLRQELAESGGLVLLDGLDGVPQSKGHRARVIRIMGQFRERFGKCRILVTSRGSLLWRWRRSNRSRSSLLCTALV